MIELYYKDEYDRGYDYVNGAYIYGDDYHTPDEYLDERWWYIEGAPGYMISDHGRVWSDRTQKFLKPKPLDRLGHLGVCLYIDGRRQYVYIHRLMAKAFILNPKNYPIVRHLNDIPNDNALENLAWGSQRDNIYDCIKNGRNHVITKDEREIGLTRIRKPIVAVYLKTGDTYEFSGQSEASRVLGIHQANIWKVLNGERRQACGYYFEYMRGDHNGCY